MNISIILFHFLFATEIFGTHVEIQQVYADNEAIHQQLIQHLFTNFATEIIVNDAETNNQVKIIDLLKILSGWIVKDKMEGIYNSDIKYITVDETGDNFVCELCNFAVQNNLKTPRKNIAYEFKNNKKIKRDIYKHLKGYSDFHANLIETMENENNSENVLVQEIQTKYNEYETLINIYNQKFHYAPSIRSGIILNYGGYEYNEDTEKSEQKNAAFTKYYHCNKTRCNCRARIVNNQFSFSNNHVCNSNNFLNDIRAQWPVHNEDNTIGVSTQETNYPTQPEYNYDPNLLHGNPAYRTQFDEDHNIAMNLHYEQIRDQQSVNPSQSFGYGFDQNYQYFDQEHSSHDPVFPSHDNAQQNIGGSSSSQHHTGASSYTNQPLDSQYQPSHFQQHTPGIEKTTEEVFHDLFGDDPDDVNENEGNASEDHESEYDDDYGSDPDYNSNDD